MTTMDTSEIPEASIRLPVVTRPGRVPIKSWVGMISAGAT